MSTAAIPAKPSARDVLAEFAGCAGQVAAYSAGETLRLGGVQPGVTVLLRGLVAIERPTSSGRAITALCLPGDVVAFPHDIWREERAVGLMSGRYAYVTSAQLQGEARDVLAGTLAVHAARRRRIAEEWLVSLGRRRAEERVAHFICEFVHRHTPGAGATDRLRFPFTQVDLAGVTGLSAVHVTRCVQSLRKRQWVRIGGHELRVVDPLRLRQFAGFDPSYLRF